MLHWDDPIGFIKGATPAVRRGWSSLGIATIGDLLERLPRRYDDYSHIVSIRDALPGEIVTIRGTVVSCKKLHTFKKRFQIVRTVVKDASGSIAVTFFNQPWILEAMKPEMSVVVSGKMAADLPYGKTIRNPLWEPAGDAALAAGKLAPVYGLAGTLYQKTYRRLVQQTLGDVQWPDDRLTEHERHARDLASWRGALGSLHAPQSAQDAERGRCRFAFDELTTYQLALKISSREAARAGSPAISFDEKFARHFAGSLPFPLTNDQKKAVWASLLDMEKEKPMRRLLQGDVGAGKTAVAAFLAAHTARAGLSTAILAPTDILARQHAATFQRLCAPHRVPILLVTRTEKRRFCGREEEVALDGKNLAAEIERGGIVVIGTHAILEAGRLPPDLALAVVDEQHRFGVDQREALTVRARSDGRIPHFLSMTATPIPRSLALTLYGDLDVSVLREKPPGRTPVKTEVCQGRQRERAYEEIRLAVARGEQAFVVCALIDPSDSLGASSTTDVWKDLNAGPLKGLRIGLLHGRLKGTEKEATMQHMMEKRLDVLVATSVIEVGVDIPNATVMAIEGAERFGLAQLHQLRGRVGRAKLPSKCFLMTDVDGDSLVRLLAVVRISDGFQLAEEDLKMRGSGSLFGTEQSGFSSFQAARYSDHDLMHRAKTFAEQVLQEDQALAFHPGWKALVDRLRTTAHGE